SEIRAIMTRSGGTLGESGSVSWMFDQVGHIVVNPGSLDPDEVALVAIDAGATDVQVESDTVDVYTELADLHRVQEALVAAGLEVTEASPVMRPKTLVTPDDDTAVKALRLLEKLEDLDDVQQVYTNLDVTEEVLAQVG